MVDSAPKILDHQDVDRHAPLGGINDVPPERKGLNRLIQIIVFSIVVAVLAGIFINAWMAIQQFMSASTLCRTLVLSDPQSIINCQSYHGIVKTYLDSLKSYSAVAALFPVLTLIGYWLWGRTPPGQPPIQ